MSPELSLHFAAIFLSYSLKIAAAYLACRMLNRLLPKPQQRFLMWMIFLLAAGTYWLALIFWELRALPSPATGAGNLVTPNTPASFHSFLIPPGWSHTVLIAGQVLGLAYASAVLLLIGVAAWRHLRLRLLLRQAMGPSDALAALFRETSHDFGISRCQLAVLPGLRSPATACSWSPRILLPEVCEELGPTPQLADVLCHELVHVARHDYLWAGVSDLICRLLFFHPAAWHARKWMRLQGELACDLAVVEARPGHRADYADSLAYFVRLRMLQEGVALGVDFAASALGLRIRTILEAPQPMPWWKRLSQMTAALALVGTFGILAPALTVFVDFAHPVPEQASVLLPVQVAPASAHTGRRPQHRQQPAQTPIQDSLTNLRTRSSVPETSAFALTASGGGRPTSEEPGAPTPVWRESNPSARVPTVSSVVLSTVGQIAGASRIPHGGHGRDRDDH